MIDYEKVLRKDEKAIYNLRELYERYGYRMFRANKFEEYELYARNKDFLGSEGILTFTDSKGNLMALKPDMTISIAKLAEDTPGVVQKYYYNDDVYRLTRGTASFSEIPQAGIECMGDIGSDDVSEVISLAVKSLALISEDIVLDISHMGIVKGLVDMLDLKRGGEKEMIGLIAGKNAAAVSELCELNGVSEEMTAKMVDLVGLYGPMDKIIGKLEGIASNETMELAVKELVMINDALKAEGLDGKAMFDFSVINDMGYYDGVIFQGFVKGIPESILSGGRYDSLMSKMGRRGGAIGFSVSLDSLDDIDRAGKAIGTGKKKQDTVDDGRTIDIALPKGRLGESVYEMFEAAGFECEAIRKKSRKLIFENKEKGVRFFWVKPSDVAIYVERGAADIGVAGKDILLESGAEVYELLDMKVGKCDMMVAAGKNWTDDADSTLRVATKFPNIAERFYKGKSRDIDIIKLNGSIELAPLLGLSDVIVDIVETGNTLRANGLEPKETIVPLSARLIANKASFKFKNEQIETIAKGLKDKVDQIDQCD